MFTVNGGERTAARASLQERLPASTTKMGDVTVSRLAGGALHLASVLRPTPWSICHDGPCRYPGSPHGSRASDRPTVCMARSMGRPGVPRFTMCDGSTLSDPAAKDARRSLRCRPPGDERSRLWRRFMTASLYERAPSRSHACDARPVEVVRPGAQTLIAGVHANRCSPPTSTAPHLTSSDLNHTAAERVQSANEDLSRCGAGAP